MSQGKIVLGLLAGIAAGAVLGILFAPEKGSKTRQQILDKSDEYAGELKSKMDGLADSITEKYEKTKHQAEEYASKAKSKFGEVKSTMDGAMSDKV
jgi:gas vesicle protein